MILLVKLVGAVSDSENVVMLCLLATITLIGFEVNRAFVRLVYDDQTHFISVFSWSKTTSTSFQ